MTTAQVVETSVTVNNNSPIQDYVHPNDQTQPKITHVVEEVEKTYICRLRASSHKPGWPG